MFSCRSTPVSSARPGDGRTPVLPGLRPARGASKSVLRRLRRVRMRRDGPGDCGGWSDRDRGSPGPHRRPRLPSDSSSARGSPSPSGKSFRSRFLGVSDRSPRTVVTSETRPRRPARHTRHREIPGPEKFRSRETSGQDGDGQDAVSHPRGVAVDRRRVVVEPVVSEGRFAGRSRTCF